MVGYSRAFIVRSDDLSLLWENCDDIVKTEWILEREARKVGLNCDKTEYLNMKHYKDNRLSRKDLHVRDIT